MIHFAYTCLRSLPCRPRRHPRESCWFCSNSPVAGGRRWGQRLETKPKVSKTQRKYAVYQGTSDFHEDGPDTEGKTKAPRQIDRPDPTEPLTTNNTNNIIRSNKWLFLSGTPELEIHCKSHQVRLTEPPRVVRSRYEADNKSKSWCKYDTAMNLPAD